MNNHNTPAGQGSSQAPARKTRIQEGYDRVAVHYAEEYFGELSRKPFDRELLDQFAATVRGRGQVCEIGCGPGQIARYLKDRGVDMCGIDISAEMVGTARRLNPEISFSHGDMLALDFADNSFAGVVLFYAIIHLRREDMITALKEMHRVLQPGGRILLSFHGGEGELHKDEWYGESVSIDVTLMTREEMSGYLETAGFQNEGIAKRDPYDFEYPTERLYARAMKPKD